MAILLKDSHRKYRRWRHDAQEKMALTLQGFTPVLSSCVSALMTDGDDLLIRFHTGDVYRYPGNARYFEKILNSNSKGHYFWVYLRWPGEPFIKEGKILKLESDIKMEVEDFIKEYVERPQIETIKYLEEIGLFIIDPNMTNLGALLSL